MDSVQVVGIQTPQPHTCPATSSNWVTTLPYNLHSLFPSRLGNLDKSHSFVQAHTAHGGCIWGQHCLSPVSWESAEATGCFSSPWENVGVWSHHYTSFPSCFVIQQAQCLDPQ